MGDPDANQFRLHPRRLRHNWKTTENMEKRPTAPCHTDSIGKSSVWVGAGGHTTVQPRLPRGRTTRGNQHVWKASMLDWRSTHRPGQGLLGEIIKRRGRRCTSARRLTPRTGRPAANTELGARAAHNDAEKIEALVHRARMVVFLMMVCRPGRRPPARGQAPTDCGGPRKKQGGGWVLAFVGAAVSFEGDRRKQQALSGLEQLKAASGRGPSAFRMTKSFRDRRAGTPAVVDAFKARRRGISSWAVQGRVWQLAWSRKRASSNLDFADLRHDPLARSTVMGLFQLRTGWKARNRGRAEAVKALAGKNPLLDGGRCFSRRGGRPWLVSILGRARF